MTVISIDGHPLQEELVCYVSDTLPPAEAQRLESHVFECELCAARLQQAASFQMLLHDAAAAMEAQPLRPARPAASRGWRTRAKAGLWAAAAAAVLVICQQGGHVLTEPSDQTQILILAESTAEGATLGEGDAVGSNGLLASVEPLQSIDPLQTWPDDPFEGADWPSDEPLDGEPCGSGEDGGTLVCRPISG